MPRPKVAIIDDYQDVARTAADWDRLDADVTIFNAPWRDLDHTAEALQPFSVVSLMRERTAFPAELIGRLPQLRLLSMTGRRSTTLDLAACTRHGVAVSVTDGSDSDATAELAVGLMIACARAIPRAADNMRRGLWQDGLPVGRALKNQVLGIVGLGRLGSRVAATGRALGMEVIAWSPNLTPERAAAGGATLVGKAELFERAFAVSVHMTLSDRTRGLIGRNELSRMAPGSILINTARAPLVDADALMEVLRAGRVTAGLDVFWPEPLPPGHELRSLPNVVLTPHLGYAVADVYDWFHKASLANIDAFLAGHPTNLLNPEALHAAR